MNYEIQSILLRRKSKIYFQTINDLKGLGHPANRGMVGAIIANVAELGYVLDNKLIKELRDASPSELEKFYLEIMALLKAQLGVVRHKPMYPNFPKQVAEAAYEELWINAIMHYFGDAIGTRIMPEYEEEPRFPFCELTKAKWIGLATKEDAEACFKSILEAKSSPSVQDKEDMAAFVANNYSCTPVFTNKETLGYFVGYIGMVKKFQITAYPTFEAAYSQVKTATDVLRIVVAYSEGDISLATNTKFKNMSRSMRRMLLHMLDNMNQESVGEDMMRYRGMWVRLGEKLHAGEFTTKFPKIAETFRLIRNGGAPTFNSTVERAMKIGDWFTLLATLQKRPGDFARRLNAVLSKAENKQSVINTFRAVATKVSTPVLWQLYGYFVGRDTLCAYKNRMFLPKGNTPTALVSDNNLTPIARAYTTELVKAIEKALEIKYSEKESMEGKKVFIDESAINLLIPTGNRSASTALRQVGRGSRFQIGVNKSTIRLFVYWKDVEKSADSWSNRVDLDLSAVMYDRDWNCLGQCSWTQLRHGSGNQAAMVHSGDITSAPNGASEFLDINLDKLSSNVAYIAANVFCYTGQKMTQLDVGFMGWMEREYPGSGEIYEPKSVQGRCDLTADATSTCPLILDVQSREIVWADLAVTINGGGRSVHNTVIKSIATADLVTRMAATRATLYELFVSNIIARKGEIVSKREDANYVIAEDGDLSPYDVATIMADWM